VPDHGPAFSVLDLVSKQSGFCAHKSARRANQ
jgi:hypothetical protein